MATYIVLSSFTEQGVRNIKDTTKRADSVRDLARKFGATVRDIYWTMGHHDVVVVFDAPTDQLHGCGATVDRATDGAGLPMYGATWATLAADGFCVLPAARFVAGDRP